MQQRVAAVLHLVGAWVRGTGNSPDATGTQKCRQFSTVSTFIKTRRREYVFLFLSGGVLRWFCYLVLASAHPSPLDLPPPFLRKPKEKKV